MENRLFKEKAEQKKRDKRFILYVPMFRSPIELQKQIIEPVAEILTGEVKTEAELLPIVQKVDAVLLTSRTHMTRKVIETCPNLKLIAKYGVGVENIDVEAATEQGILVTNVPTTNSNATAELTIGLMLAALRGIQKARDMIRSGAWHDDRFPGRELSGCTIGVIGYGDIAKQVIKKLQGFEVRSILVFTETKSGEGSAFPNVSFVDLETVLKESDIVSIHKALTARSRGLLGEKELQSMRREAYLVNTSRARLVEEASLIKALREGWIAGAALDVHWQEPLPKDSPFLSMENVVLTPHLGGATHEARQTMVVLIARNIADFFQGKGIDPKYVVNPVVLSRKP